MLPHWGYEECPPHLYAKEAARTAATTFAGDSVESVVFCCSWRILDELFGIVAVNVGCGCLVVDNRVCTECAGPLSILQLARHFVMFPVALLMQQAMLRGHGRRYSKCGLHSSMQRRINDPSFIKNI